jgi:hypothetical protein
VAWVYFRAVRIQTNKALGRISTPLELANKPVLEAVLSDSAAAATDVDGCNKKRRQRR